MTQNWQLTLLLSGSLTSCYSLGPRHWENGCYPCRQANREGACQNTFTWQDYWSISYRRTVGTQSNPIDSRLSPSRPSCSPSTREIRQITCIISWYLCAEQQNDPEKIELRINETLVLAVKTGIIFLLVNFTHCIYSSNLKSIILCLFFFCMNEMKVRQ